MAKKKRQTQSPYSAAMMDAALAAAAAEAAASSTPATPPPPSPPPSSPPNKDDANKGDDDGFVDVELCGGYGVALASTWVSLSKKEKRDVLSVGHDELRRQLAIVTSYAVDASPLPPDTTAFLDDKDVMHPLRLKLDEALRDAVTTAAAFDAESGEPPLRVVVVRVPTEMLVLAAPVFAVLVGIGRFPICCAFLLCVG
jgi:hypothetical protein